jgi:hypothetical protein
MMHQKKLLIILSLSSVLTSVTWAQQSAFAPTFGVPRIAGDASTKGMADAGHSNPEICAGDLLNPASAARCGKVGFGASFSVSETRFENAGGQMANSAVSLQQVRAILPMPWLTLGFDFAQQASRDLSVETASTEWEMAGGISTISPSIALTIPGLSNWSLGGALQIYSGTTREVATWTTEEIQKTILTSTDMAEGYGSTGSLAYKNRNWGGYVGGSLASKIDLKRSQTLQTFYSQGYVDIGNNVFSNSSPLITVDPEDGWIESPGDALRKQDLMLEGSAPWMFAAGYSLGGSEKPYDAFWKRMNLRGGASVRQTGLDDLLESKVGLGAGLPLGRRGSRMDLGLELGRRGAIDGEIAGSAGTIPSGATEDFVNLWVSFHGFGNWGQPSRRYR